MPTKPCGFTVLSFPRLPAQALPVALDDEEAELRRALAAFDRFQVCRARGRCAARCAALPIVEPLNWPFAHHAPIPRCPQATADQAVAQHEASQLVGASAAGGERGPEEEAAATAATEATAAGVPPAKPQPMSHCMLRQLLVSALAMEMDATGACVRVGEGGRGW